MLNQRSCSSPEVAEPDGVAEVVLGLLLDADATLLTVEELVRQMAAGVAGDLPGTEVAVQDALVDLVSHGLVHRLERFVFASQAAIRGSVLAV